MFDEFVVVAVDDFTHDPGIGVLLFDPGDDLCPEVGSDRVGGVESPAIDATTKPMGHDVDYKVDGCGVAVVQPEEVFVSFENVGGAVRLQVEEFGVIEVFAGVAEHSVEKHAETPVFAFGEKYVEVGLVAEAGVDFKIVIDVVAVAVGGKNGIQKQS